MTDLPMNRTHAQRRAAGLAVGLTAMQDLVAAGPAPASPATAGSIEERMGALGSFMIDHVFGDVWSRPQLSRRDRSLITVTTITVIDRPEQLRAHVRFGRRNGLTPAELHEIMVHLTVYAGWPRAINGASIVRAALEETGEAAPLSPATPRSDAERLAAASVSAADLEAQYGPVGRYIAAYVAGEVWSRPELPPRDRSLVTVAALAALNRPEELRLHTGRALANGVRREEIEELMLQVATYAGFPAGVDGMRVVRSVFAALDAGGGAA